MLSFKQNKELNILLGTFIGVLALVPIVLGALYNPLNCDSAYYLSIVERISEGNRLYSDLCCGYTPLWFYLMAGMKWLLRIPMSSLAVYQLIHYLMLISCGVFVYLILRNLQVVRVASFLAGWLFLMMSHWMQGNDILLEVPSMLFGLMALWLSLKLGRASALWFLLIGLLCSCSFLCKQFGLGFLVLAAMVIIFFAEGRLHKLIALCIGSAVPVLICVIIWQTDFVGVLFPGYGTKSAAAAGRDVSLLSKMSDVMDNILELFTKNALILPISLLFLKSFYREGKLKVVCLCWCGVIGFMLQFYFVPGGLHYKLYVLPFVALLVGLLLSLDLRHWWHKILLYVPLGVTILYSVYADYNNRVRKLYLHPEIKQRNEIIAEKVHSIAGGNSLWIVHGGLFPVYYYSNLLPPNMNTIGYSFGPLGLNEEKGFEQAQSADYVLSFVADYPFESFYTDSLRNFVWQHEVVYINDDVVLHNMRNKLQ